MSTLTGAPYGQTETGAACTEASARYAVVAGRESGTASYAVAILAAIASGNYHTGETPTEYAQRNLGVLVTDARIRLLDAAVKA